VHDRCSERGEFTRAGSALRLTRQRRSFRHPAPISRMCTLQRRTSTFPSPHLQIQSSKDVSKARFLHLAKHGIRACLPAQPLNQASCTALLWHFCGTLSSASCGGGSSLVRSVFGMLGKAEITSAMLPRRAMINGSTPMSDVKTPCFCAVPIKCPFIPDGYHLGYADLRQCRNAEEIADRQKLRGMNSSTATPNLRASLGAAHASWFRGGATGSAMSTRNSFGGSSQQTVSCRNVTTHPAHRTFLLTAIAIAPCPSPSFCLDRFEPIAYTALGRTTGTKCEGVPKELGPGIDAADRIVNTSFR
jgi:hypothetical protein